MTEQQAETIISLLKWGRFLLIVIGMNLYLWFVLFCLLAAKWQKLHGFVK